MHSSRINLAHTIVFQGSCLIFANPNEVRYMMSCLLQISAAAQPADSAFWFFPVGIQLLFAIFLVVFIMVVTHILGPKRQTSDKLATFTSGIPSHGDARHPMAIKYFLVAILFVLFDVEVIFFYPYAVNFKSLGWDGFKAVLMFVGFFLAGFIYIWKKGALNWED